MSMSDPIADMLTRVRNAQAAGHKTVEVPHSKIKAEMARVLKAEGYVSDFTTEGATHKVLTVYLKYGPGQEPVIRGIRRESRSGLRKYCGAGDVPRVLGGLGVSILSTSVGVMTGQEARQKNVGGEVLCSVW